MKCFISAQDPELPMTGLFEALLAAKQLVDVYNFQDHWLDVGVPDDLRRAWGRA
jgi:NDP-sugar pyrophosphorylase family protein